MVSTLRCRLVNSDFTQDYNRFIRDKRVVLTKINDATQKEWVDEAVLDENPALVRTLSVKPPRGTGRLRLVRIGDGEIPVDLQPCGGTHVARTGEIRERAEV